MRAFVVYEITGPTQIDVIPHSRATTVTKVAEAETLLGLFAAIEEREIAATHERHATAKRKAAELAKATTHVPGHLTCDTIVPFGQLPTDGPTHDGDSPVIVPAN